MQDAVFDFKTLTVLIGSAVYQYDWDVSGEFSRVAPGLPRVASLEGINDARAFSWDPLNPKRLVVMHGENCFLKSYIVSENRTVTSGSMPFESTVKTVSDLSLCVDFTLQPSINGESTTIFSVEASGGSGILMSRVTTRDPNSPAPGSCFQVRRLRPLTEFLTPRSKVRLTNDQ